MLSPYAMLCLFSTTAKPMIPFGLTYFVISLLTLLNTFTFPASFSFKNDKLVVQHVIFATRYDLAKLTGYEVNPDAMMSALPLTFPILVASAWYRSPLLGTFRAYISDQRNCVVLEFGQKKIVVTPENPQEFVEALREQARGTVG